MGGGQRETVKCTILSQVNYHSLALLFRTCFSLHSIFHKHYFDSVPLFVNFAKVKPWRKSMKNYILDGYFLRTDWLL